MIFINNITYDDSGRSSYQNNSILPRDKTFAPGMFLALVHGNISFDEMKIGLENLKALLDQQSNQRESLVRSHFGLFVQCAEGLDWLKAYRKGSTYSAICLTIEYDL